MIDQQSDTVLRAITNDGAFRVIAACTTQTVRAILAVQGAQGAVASSLADLLTGSILVRETMAPQLRVQGILRMSGERGSLVADSHPDGSTRGLINIPSGDQKLSVDEGALLQMMRTLPNHAVHQGVIAFPKTGGLSAALMTYMQQSEQIASVIAVDTIRDSAHPEVLAAGGYIVQLLPEVQHSSLQVMTDRLHRFESLQSLLGTSKAEPRTLVEQLLSGMPFTQLEERPIRFQCQCSQMRLLASLTTIQPAEIEWMIHEGQMLEIQCDYCRKEYQINPEQLRGLLEQS